MRLKLFGKVALFAPAEHSSALAVFRPENAPDGPGERAPLAALFEQLFAALGSERVKPRLAIVRRDAPLRRNPALRLQPLQRRIQRAVLDQQHVFGLFLDNARDALPMLWAKHQRAQNQQIEGALQESDSGRHLTQV